MARYKSIAIWMGMLFISLLAWGAALAYGQQIALYDQDMELRYEEPLKLHQLEVMKKEEANSKQKIISDFVAWKQTKEQNLYDKELGREVKVDDLTLYGNTNMLIDAAQLVGQSLAAGDKEGILMTEKVAYDLWGSLDVIGQRVELNDKTYTVKGLIKDKQAYIIRQEAEVNQEAKFDALRIKFMDNENIEGQVETLGLKYNLPKGTVINLSLESIFLSQLVLLPGWMIGFWGLIKLYKYLYQTRSYWISTLVFGMALLGLTWFMIRVMGFKIEIPSYLLPAQWSDFEFWGQLVTRLQGQHEAVQSLPKLRPDFWRIELSKQVWGYTILTITGFIVTLNYQHKKKLNQLFSMALGSIVLSFMVVVLLYRLGLSVVATQGFWIGIPMYLVMGCFLNGWRKLLDGK